MRLTGPKTAQLIGCAVLSFGLRLPASAAIAPGQADKFADCMRTTPTHVAGHVGREDVEGCLRATGFTNVPSDDSAVVDCVSERYPAGDLGACLAPLADLPQSSASPLETASAAAAGASPGAVASSEPAAAAGAPSAAPPPEEATPQPVVTESTGELPWWPLGVAFLLGGAMAAAITYFAVRSEPRPLLEEEAASPNVAEGLPATVAISAPRDLSVQPCGAPIALSANTVPPERASEVSWSVTAPDNREIASGSGAQFTFTGAVTGVYHVVAHLDRAADDLLLFLFKTPSGGTSVSDLLESEKPWTPRDPTGYVWHRHRTL